MSTTVTHSKRHLNIDADEINADLNGTINTATTAITQAASDNTTKVSTTAFVKSQGYITTQSDTQDLSQSGNTVSLVDGGSVDISTTTAVAANTAKPALIDEDYMTSNSATQVPSQQSVKAYVDAKVWDGNDITTGIISSSRIPTLNQNTTGTAAKATNLDAADDRDMAPEDYGYTDDFRIFFSSKEGLEDGSTVGTNYQDTLYLNSYGDSSGGDANILAFDKSEKAIYHYQADQAATNWGTAKQLAYTDSNITGNAATATALTSGDKTITGNLTVGSSSQTLTSLHLTATNTDGAGAISVQTIMQGYEARGQGTFHTDTSKSGEEWFSGINYAGAFDKWSVGYDLAGGQAEYLANALFTVSHDGNVGIGTTSPNETLEVNSGATNTVASFRSTDNQAWISVQDDDSGTYGALYGTDSDLGLDVAIAGKSADIRLGIDSSGNVGIGTTSPSEKLDVVGNIAVSGTVTASDFIGPLNGAVQFTAKNTSGGTLTVGQVVYISGISGNTPTVGLADADDSAKMPAYGLVAVETINNDPVEIVTFGPLTNVKTDYAGWAVGDTLYVSTTPGTLTNVAPTGEGTLIQNLGRIRRVQQSAGSITVGGAGRTNATPNLNEGRLFVGNASNQAVADSTAYVDIANSRVGIGTTSPSVPLEVIDTSFGGAGIRITAESVGVQAELNLNRVSSSRAAQVVHALNGSNEWFSGLIRAGGNAISGYSISTVSDTNTTPPQFHISTNGDVDVAGNILPGITTIKILPRDFIADDGGRPIAIDDGTTGNRHIESFSSYPMFASVEIPPGFKATLVDIYGTLTSAVTVYEANITTRAVTSRGTGNIGTQINITDVTSDATNYLLIELAQTSVEQVFGGKVTIAKV